MSTSPSPAVLPSSALARRLSELCRAERNLQADFLLHLAEFDVRHAYLEAGYGSLWAYCTEALHLREGAAGRRTRAMKVLRDFPRLEPALRDGRLCLTTLAMLAPVLTDANLEALVAQAAFRSKDEVDMIVATLQPRTAPKDGLRRLPGNADGAAGGTAPSTRTSAELALVRSTSAPASVPPPATAMAESESFTTGAPVSGAPSGGASSFPASPVGSNPPGRARSRVELQPVARDLYSLRVTVDETFKRDLHQLASLTSHTTRGDLRAVLHEALRCAIAKHGKRRGAIAPERKRTPKPEETMRAEDVASLERAPLPPAPAAANEPASAVTTVPVVAPAPGPSPTPCPCPPDARHAPASSSPPSRDPRFIPIEVRRAVWDRDGGRCAWVSPDGRRCGSRYQLEVDHIEPVALGGQSTLANCRLACKGHNIHSGFKALGFETMAPHLSKFTDPGEVDGR